MVGDKESSEYTIGKVPLPLAVTVLVGEILKLANRLLPAKQCALLQTLPMLVHHSVSQLDPTLRSRSNVMITNLHNQINKTHTRGVTEER